MSTSLLSLRLLRESTISSIERLLFERALSDLCCFFVTVLLLFEPFFENGGDFPGVKGSFVLSITIILGLTGGSERDFVHCLLPGFLSVEFGGVIISLSLDDEEEDDIKNEEYTPGFSELEESKSVPKASSSDLLLNRVFWYSKIILEEEEAEVAVVIAIAAEAADLVVSVVSVVVLILDEAIAEVYAFLSIEKLYEGIIPSCIVPGIIWK